MSDLARKIESWKRYDEAREEERRRIDFLRQPPAKNPEHLTRLVKIKRTGRGFIGPNGQGVEMGQIVTVSYATARELVYLGRAEFVT